MAPQLWASIAFRTGRTNSISLGGRTLSSPSSTSFSHVHRHSKVFDISWVESTLVRLFARAACGTSCAISCMARSPRSVLDTWEDSGIAQATVSSRLCGGMPLVCSSPLRPSVLQDSCTLMTLRCQQSASLICRSLWTLSQDGVFGPKRSVLSCSVHLGRGGRERRRRGLTANCEGVSSSGRHSYTHSHGLPTPVAWSHRGTGSSPSVSHGAKLEVSPDALPPPSSPPTCCPASPRV